ncbi:MAG: hypothetical protein P9L97_05965 [Candidatus Tenebribacter davisii]|nr:hypothetical protein [Candidatus Tenebribacter davisii]
MAKSPNTDNYTLGKGVVYFNQLVSDEYTGERDLGNAPAFTFNIALEKLEHYSSRGGLKAKDKEIISQITPGLSFTLDEVNKENFALLTLGTITATTQAGATITDEEIKDAHLGMRMLTSKRAISAVIIGDDATPTITYVAGPASNPLANYEISTTLKDAVIGRILIHEDQSGCVAKITEGQTLFVDYTSGAIAYDKISAFANTQVEGFLRFVSDNPAGLQQELQVWRVSLTPSGDTALIGDDWSTLGFTGEILKDETNHASSPYADIIMNQVSTA